jgi:hypothetical protein
MYASRDGIFFDGAAVDEGPGRCVEKGGSLHMQFPLSAGTGWKDVSGDLRLTWQAGGFSTWTPGLGGNWCGQILPTVLATDLTLSPDGHLRASATVQGWPSTQACLTDGGPDGDVTRNVEAGTDAGSNVAQTITVEGPLDFSLPSIPTGYCNGNAATVIVPSDGTPMVFPCHSAWSDPTVFVVPDRCMNGPATL